MNLASTTPLLLALLVLLLIVAFSSGTEVAMLSVNRYRIRHLAQAGSGTARTLERLLQKPDDWLGANLVILAAASTFASAIATILAQRTGYFYAVPLAVGLLTIVVIVFCELAPKIYRCEQRRRRGAARHPHLPRAGAGHAPGRCGSPTPSPTAFCVCSAWGALRAARRRSAPRSCARWWPRRHRSSRRATAQMLLSILDLGRVTVDDVMIPRQEIAGIDVNESWEDILDLLRQTPHTRLPVYEGELDNLIGMLHMKRVAQELARGTLTRERLLEMARSREPYFVPEGTALNVQLGAFSAQPPPPRVRGQ